MSGRPRRTRTVVGIVLAAAFAAVAALVGLFVGSEGMFGVAVEITVRLESGALVAIVQDVEEPGFKPGDRVRVLSDGVMSRVTR